MGKLLITGTKHPVLGWTEGVKVDENAKQQLRNIANLPIVYSHIAVMPDVHLGKGATVGSVVPTKGAIIPAAVGVDIGCGMCAVKTSLKAEDLPESLAGIREAIEKEVPHGRSNSGKKGDKGAHAIPPKKVVMDWRNYLKSGYERIIAKHGRIERNAYPTSHLGTLGSGNHFIEVCLDKDDNVWVMLHSGSRGIGNRIGTYFIELAKKDIENLGHKIPDKDLAYLKEGTQHFDDYVEAVEWAQEYASINRKLMLEGVLTGMRKSGKLPQFSLTDKVVNCHHNYVQKEVHFGEECFVTRKGAVRAGPGELGIIPGSMGARSYIVRGRGESMSFLSCSHGAGRVHSRSAAKRLFTVEDHCRATEGVECRKDQGVIDETPGAYKDIADVMRAQDELVETVHELRQIICVKG